MMNQDEKQLWDRINSFRFDEPGTVLTFEKRLSRENGWDLNYTQDVIEEYKKFIFLCCISDSPITPSDQVDQAWHLHMIYTKSYWIDFCKNTLGQEIHHNPTKGGNSEQTKFKDLYAHTFLLYHEKFETPAPGNIWLNSEKRFSEIHFQRINTNAFWIIKKPTKRIMALTFITVIVFAGLLNIQSQNSETNGFILFLFIMVGVIIYAASKSKGGGNGNGGGCSSGISGCSASGHHDGEGGGDSGCSGCGGCGGGD